QDGRWSADRTYRDRWQCASRSSAAGALVRFYALLPPVQPWKIEESSSTKDTKEHIEMLVDCTLRTCVSFVVGCYPASATRPLPAAWATSPPRLRPACACVRSSSGQWIHRLKRSSVRRECRHWLRPLFRWQPSPPDCRRAFAPLPAANPDH